MKAMFISKWRGIEPDLPIDDPATGTRLEYCVKTDCPDMTVLVEVKASEETIRWLEQTGLDAGDDSPWQHIEDVIEEVTNAQ